MTKVFVGQVFSQLESGQIIYLYKEGDRQNDLINYYRSTMFISNRHVSIIAEYWRTNLMLVSFYSNTGQKIKFSIKFSCTFLQIWSHLLKKSLMENFIFYAVKNRDGSRILDLYIVINMIVKKVYKSVVYKSLQKRKKAKRDFNAGRQFLFLQI